MGQKIHMRIKKISHENQSEKVKNSCYKVMNSIRNIKLRNQNLPHFCVTARMKHYRAKPSARLQAIQPSAAWQTLDCNIARLDISNS